MKTVEFTEPELMALLGGLMVFVKAPGALDVFTESGARDFADALDKLSNAL